MQYVKCKFRPSDTRTYTYQWNGEPLRKGDVVKVADNRDPAAWKRVWVEEVTDEAPSFACKPILGIYNPDAEAADLPAAAATPAKADRSDWIGDLLGDEAEF